MMKKEQGEGKEQKEEILVTIPEKNLAEYKGLIDFFMKAMELGRQRGAWAFEEAASITEALNRGKELLKD